LVCVLLVDDEPAFLTIATTILEKKGGFCVHGVGSAKEAHDLLCRKSYDVIISDYEMPDKDGLTFLKELRNEGYTIPFIIFTGRGREDVAIEALNRGADFYIQKTGSPQTLYPELINIIKKTYEKKKAEQELVTSERCYRAVVEGQTELISRFTPDWKQIFVNDAFCRYYQTSRENIVGIRFIPTIPDEDKEKITQHFQDLAPESPVAFIEHRVTLPDGTTRWQQWSDLAIFGDNSEVIEYQSVGRDITEKKEMEIAVIENLNYVKALMDTIPVPVFYRDTHGVYQDCNRAFELLVGMTRGGIIGKNIHDLFPKELADHYRHMDDLIISKPYIQQYEYLINNANGEKLDVLFSKTAFIGADGSVKGIVGVIFDISERKTFEKIIHQSEEKYRTIAEFTYDWEAWLNPEGGYLYVSPSCERITGYSTREFINDPELVISITHPEDRRVMEDHYHNMNAEKGDICHMDYRIITKSGEERWISHFCQSVFRDDGTWLGRRESKRDITIRKKIEKAHEKANIKLNLLSNITRHDVLNQLSGLIGYADMALEASEDPEIRTMLERVLTAANTITEQISFTRIYQDIGVHAPVWHHIPTVISRASSGIRLNIDVAPDLECIEVNVDPLIEKVFFCLLDNSQRHGRDVRSARFSRRHDGTDLILVYEDDGGGIVEQDKKRIFERGFGRNTGYGLFLSREILAVSGNYIRETGMYGEGVTFEIGFPEGSYRCLPVEPT